MARRFISPKLADVTQDIAGPIPVDLIRKWSKNTKSGSAHHKLLADYTIKGTVVVSDSSGLSKLAKSKSLLEVMWLVHKPKETIFSFGTAVGGKAIGVWAADNTEMIYNSSIDVGDILQGLISAQKSLTDFPVKIGLAVHSGEFVEIGGGLYGQDADFVESIGENHTDGGEITVTDVIAENIPTTLRKLLVGNNDFDINSNTYDLLYAGITAMDVPATRGRYPAPFPFDFYDLLTRFKREYPMQVQFTKYQKSAVVILVKIWHPKRVFLLDTFSDWILANSIIEGIVENEGVQQIKSNGSLAIFVSQNSIQAIDFARLLYDALDSNAYAVTIGLSQGEVLVFPLEAGGYEIAGGPVNIASKLAEDAGVNSGILIEASVLKENKALKHFEDFMITISGVDIHGMKSTKE